MKLPTVDPVKPWLIFGAWVFISVLPLRGPSRAWFISPPRNDNASHILLTPFIPAWLLYAERKDAPSDSKFTLWPAAAFFVPSTFLVLFSANYASWSPRDRLSAYTFSFFFGLGRRICIDSGRGQSQSQICWRHAPQGTEANPEGSNQISWPCGRAVASSDRCEAARWDSKLPAPGIKH